MDITRWIKKNRTVIIDKDDIIIAEKLIALQNSMQVLLKKNHKLKKKIKSNKIIIDKLESQKKLLLIENTTDFRLLKPNISIGFDKRSSTYNCIVNAYNNKFSFYLGKEQTIKRKIKMFYSSDISNLNMKNIKLKLNNIIESVISKYYSPLLKTNFNTTRKLNFNKIIEKYIESGDWNYYKPE
tara:strand:+ start:16 stop:564 length:549 start_codon:yes stop_codon:yes gene_type:complete